MNYEKLDQALMMHYTTEVLGSAEAAVLWLLTRSHYLHNRRPVDLIRHEDGRREVYDYLKKIELGIYI